MTPDVAEGTRRQAEGEEKVKDLAALAALGRRDDDAGATEE